MLEEADTYQKDIITIVKSRNLADKYLHGFITGLEGFKAENNTTFMKITQKKGY